MACMVSQVFPSLVGIVVESADMVFTNGEISGLLFAPGLVQATLSHDRNLVRVVKFEHLFIWFSFLNLIMCFPIKFYIQT